MMEWITDRQPTKEDEDKDGEVLMLRFPDCRKGTTGMDRAVVAAAHVGPGVPWMHTISWKPPATPKPEPEAPKPAPKPELRVGQVWRAKDGAEVVIESKDDGCDYPFRGSSGDWYMPDGRYWAQEESPYDLIDLITDTPAETPQPEPTPTTRKVPRLFAAPLRRTLFSSGAIVVDAIADDGTCWGRIEGRDFSRKWLGEDVRTEWQQITPLPDREEPIDA